MSILKFSSYGLKLARVVPLPEIVLEHADHVAHTLEQQTKRHQKNSAAIIQARRRKLMLNLKEHLVQAKNGKKDGPELIEWLKNLQAEFVVQMTKLDEQAQEAAMGGIDDDGVKQELEHATGRDALAQAQSDNMSVDRELEQDLQEQILLDSDGMGYIETTELGS